MSFFFCAICGCGGWLLNIFAQILLPWRNVLNASICLFPEINSQTPFRQSDTHAIGNIICSQCI